MDLVCCCTPPSGQKQTCSEKNHGYLWMNGVYLHKDLQPLPHAEPDHQPPASQDIWNTQTRDQTEQTEETDAFWVCFSSFLLESVVPFDAQISATIGQKENWLMIIIDYKGTQTVFVFHWLYHMIADYMHVAYHIWKVLHTFYIT